jgi:hypothetical protein
MVSRNAVDSRWGSSLQPVIVAVELAVVISMVVSAMGVGAVCGLGSFHIQSDFGAGS